MVNKSLFKLRGSEEVREKITAKQQKKIRRMYIDLYQSVVKQIKQSGNNEMKKQRLFALKKNIEDQIRQINEELEKDIVQNMNTVVEAVIEDTKSYLVSCGFKEEDIQGAFVHVPRQVITNIRMGTIYQDGWTLSKAIWGYNRATQEKLDHIISIDVAQGKSAYQIAKDIEQYVKPNAKKPSRTISSWRIDENGNKVKDVFRFGKVDYNAQRLARTMISHSYQQAFQNVNKNDPFIIGYKWLTSNFHGRVCEICKDRAETDKFGLGVGVFPKDKLPLDHPNGMCTFEAVSDKTPEQIAKEIDEWYNAPEGTFPELDKFAESL